MNRSYWISDITIERAPGFPRGNFPHISELSPSLNIIWGPNGIGKTTLAGALRALTWHTEEQQNLEASAKALGPDGTWKLTLYDKRLTQKRLQDNSEIELPGRKDDMAQVYWFSLSDMLRIDDANQPFHTKVYTEMQGGIDFEQVLKATGALPSFSRGNLQITKDAQDAKKALNSCKAKQTEVVQLAQEIQQLQEGQNQLDSYSKEKELYKNAKKIFELHKDLEKLQQSRIAYNNLIEYVTPHSYKNLSMLEKSLQEREGLCNTLRLDIQKLEKSLLQCSLTEKQLAQSELTTYIEELVKASESSKEQLKTGDIDLREAEKEVEVWETEHDWLISSPSEQSSFLSVLDVLKRLSHAFESKKCNLAMYEQYVTFLGSQEEITKDTQSLKHLQQSILDWIKAYASSLDTPLPVAKRNAALVTSLLIAGISSILALFVHPLCSLLSLTTLIALLRILPAKERVYSYQFAQEALQNSQEKLKNSAFNIGYEVPAVWNMEAVSSLWSMVTSDLVLLEQTVSENERRKRGEESLNRAKEALEKWYEEYERACRALNIDKDVTVLDGAQFFNFSSHITKWIELKSVVQKRRTSYEAYRQRVQEHTLKLQNVLLTDTEDLVVLHSMAKDLLSRIQESKRLLVEIETKKAAYEEARHRVTEKKEELQKFWEDCRFPKEDDLLLKELSEKREGWDILHNSIAFTTGEIQKLANQDPQSYEITQNHSEEELDRLLTEVEEHITQVKNSYETLSEKKGHYLHLTEGSDLAKAQLQYQKSLEKLEKARSQQVTKRALFVLAEHIKTKANEESMPLVLKHASTWLQKITAGRYQLFTDAHGFLAYDKIKSEHLSLDQLSDGTKVQLFFAIRMGFITTLELQSTIQLPLFMDELLANSDDVRALQIIEAIREIAKERQVFYFTAQCDEVEKFRHHAQDVFHEIPLEEVFQGSQSAERPLVVSPAIHKEIPSPVEDYHDYGKLLKVSSAQLWEPIESLHVWYLYNSSEEVFSHLRRNRTYIGQLLPLDSPMNTRLELLTRAQEYVQIGRSKPLTIHALREAPIGLNEKAAYWKSIEAQLASSGNDGNQLVKALEEGAIKRLQEHVKQALIEYLFEQAYATDQKPLDMDAILDQVTIEHSDFTLDSDDYMVVYRYLFQVLS